MPVLSKTRIDLSKLLKRPDNERAFVLIPVGYPAEDALVPDIGKKTLEQVMIHVHSGSPQDE